MPSAKSGSGPQPVVAGFFDPGTGSVQYVVSDPVTRCCAIIDPVLDFNPLCGRFTTVNADAILDHVQAQDLRVEWVLDTHPHADHFSAADYLKTRTGAPTAIGAAVVRMQRHWRQVYNLPDMAVDGSQWDRLFTDGACFQIGTLPVRVMAAPGHTCASITYRIGDAAFVHDTLFMPDSGTARADFPEADAGALWETIQHILALPPHTRLFHGHDYQPDNRAPAWESTVAAQRHNTHLAGRSRADFIRFRQKRDRTLPLPNLMLLALQVNLQGGRLPQPEANGERYLKLPVGRF